MARFHCTLSRGVLRFGVLALLLAAAAPPRADAQTRGHDAPPRQRSTCRQFPIHVKGQSGRVFAPCQLTHPARWLEPQKPPAYPALAISAGIEGTVRLKFVVDERGRIDPASVGVVRSTHEVFTEAARRALMRWRMTPPMQGATRVRELTIHDFVFAFGAPGRCPKLDLPVRDGPFEGDATLICVPAPATVRTDTAR